VKIAAAPTIISAITLRNIPIKLAHLILLPIIVAGNKTSSKYLSKTAVSVLFLGTVLDIYFS